MTLFNLIAVTDTDQPIRIYDATGTNDESEIKCIHSGLVESVDFSIDLETYEVERITLDNEFLSVTVERK